MWYAAKDHDFNKYRIQPRFEWVNTFLRIPRLRCNMRLRIMISTNLESGRDSESVNTLFTIPRLRNQLGTHISCGKSATDTVCSIVDAICGRGSWSQRIWNPAEILNQSILYLQYLGREINYELIFHAVKVRPTLFVQLWMQYAAEGHDLNKFRIQPRQLVRYMIQL